MTKIETVPDVYRMLRAGYKLALNRNNKTYPVELNSDGDVVTIWGNKMMRLLPKDVVDITRVASIPESAMIDIRQRNGLEEDDTSQDDYFNKRDPRENLADLIGWHIGDSSWLRRFESWAEACGLKLEKI